MNLLPRFIMLTSLLIMSYSSFAAPNKAVFHAHNGRIHSHPLPKEGIAHRHGGGGIGYPAKSTNQAGRISSSVTYPATRHNVKPPPVKRSNENSPLVLGPTRRASSPYLSSYDKALSSRNMTKADTRCRRGQADCNVCATNIKQQFSQAAAGRLNWRSKPWRFNWPQKYPPNGLRPLDIFDGDPAYALGIPDTHVQGFVRTNSARYPYAGSHSHKKIGGLFVIQQERDGKKYLSTLHQTRSRHPSGVAVIGKYLVYAEGGQLIFKDLESPYQRVDYRIKIPRPGFGGGLGVVKLSPNNHLLISTGPGGQKQGPRYNRFYHLKTQNGRPVSIKLVSETSNQIPAKWPKILNYSENLSVMTECGSGDIYTVHTTGDEKGVSAIRGNGYWRLSKLSNRGGQLSLNPVSAFSNQQNMSSCNVRAAATVYVNPQHKLEFYCHGYAKDPDGSLFNVLGKSSRGVDKFKLKVGTLP